MDMVKAGNYIKDKRNLKGLTQENLAEIIGVSTKAVGNWERGIGSIKLDNAVKLAEYLDVTVPEIICGEDLDSIDPKKKAEIDQWIKETNRVTIGLEDRSITTLDVAISAFGISLISAALAMWAAFGKGIFVTIVCLLVGIFGILFIAVGRKTIDILNAKLSERKERISMS